MNPSQILNEVRLRADALNGRVVLGLFDELKKSHAKQACRSGCRCSFCQALNAYVFHKIRAHHLRRAARRAEDTQADFLELEGDVAARDMQGQPFQQMIANLYAKESVHGMQARQWRAAKNMELETVV